MTRPIFLPRSQAALYLAWELGVKRAREALAWYPTDARGWVDVGSSPGLVGLSKRLATARVNEAIAYQQGRLGAPLMIALTETT